MSFEIHTRKNVRNPVPGVRVNRERTIIRFNTAAAQELAGVPALQLLIDRARPGMIGFRPTTVEDPEGYALTHIGSMCWVNCRSFINRLHLPGGVQWPIDHEGDLITAHTGVEVVEVDVAPKISVVQIHQHQPLNAASAAAVHHLSSATMRPRSAGFES